MQAGDTVALRREGQCQQNPATESCMTGLPLGAESLGQFLGTDQGQSQQKLVS